MTDAERKLIAQIRAHESWAHTPDWSARTANGRKAFNDRFEREVDPDGVLAPAERAKRTNHARKAYFARLALKSAQARRKAKEARAFAANTDAALTAAQRECYQELERRARGGA